MSRANDLCQGFLARHRISTVEIHEYEVSSICLLEQAREQIRETFLMERFGSNLVWQPSQEMLDKFYKSMAGSIVLFVSNHFSLTEATSRTAVESSINLIYILKSKPLDLSTNMISFVLRT